MMFWMAIKILTYISAFVAGWVTYNVVSKYVRNRKKDKG